MEYSSSIIRTINIFAYGEGRPNSSYGNIGVTSNNIFNKFIEYDLSKDELFVSTYGMQSVEGIINSDACDKIVMPLFPHDNEAKLVSGGEAILKYFTRYNRGSLSTVVTKRNETYIGAPGLVLDKDYNVILECGVKFYKAENHSWRRSSEFYIRISPKIFCKPDDTLNKVIIKKFIPCCIESRSRIPNLRQDHLKYPTKIIVDNDMTNILSAAKTDGSIDVKDFLLRNIDSILYQFK